MRQSFVTSFKSMTNVLSERDADDGRVHFLQNHDSYECVCFVLPHNSLSLYELVRNKDRPWEKRPHVVWNGCRWLWSAGGTSHTVQLKLQRMLHACGHITPWKAVFLTTQVVYSCTLLLRHAFIFHSFVVCAIKHQRACHWHVRWFSNWSSAPDLVILDESWILLSRVGKLKPSFSRCLPGDILMLWPESLVWLIQSLFLVGI